MHRLPILLLACLVMLLSACANPPGFTWPDRVPQIAAVPADAPTPYDRWKQARRTLEHPGLVAGAATVDLTPTDLAGTWMAGYMGGKHPTGLLTPITGRVLVLDDGATSLVLINVDFVGLMADRVAQVRRAISRRNGQDVLIASVHTHAGPDTMGMWGPSILMTIPVASGVNEAYMQRVARDLAAAVVEATRKAEPVRLSAAEVRVPEGISENLHKAGYKDDTMTLLRVESTDGARSVATLVNYACHAEFLGQNNSRLSADFPGFLYPELERLEGGVALFFNGALGGMVAPALPRRTEIAVRIREAGARRAGRVLARLASRALQSATPLDVKHIEIRRVSVDLPLENDILRWLGEKGIFSRNMSGDTLASEVWAIRLGALSMLSVPGEILPSLGFEYKGWMPGRYKMILGLANDELGYIMTEQEFGEPLYEYEASVSLGPKTGPMISEAVKKVLGGE